MQTKWDIGNSYIWIESILQSWKSHFNCLYHCWPFIKVLPLRKQLREKLCMHSLITTHDLEYYGNKHYVIIKLLYSWLRLINLRSLSDKVLVKPWRGQGGGRVCTSEGYSLYFWRLSHLIPHPSWLQGGGEAWQREQMACWEQRSGPPYI